MAFTKRRKGHLFEKAVWVLALVCVVPVLLIGWHVLNMNNRVLQNEILDKQNSIARRVSFLISETIVHQQQFISVFTDLHSVLPEHVLDIDQEDLDYIRRKNEAISYLFVLDGQGQVLLRSGTPSAVLDYLAQWPQIKKTCLQEKQPYIGPAVRSQGQVYLLMAYPLQDTKPIQEANVLVLEVNLAGLEASLQKIYPETMQVVVLDGQNKPIFTSTSVDQRLLSSASFQAQVQDMGQDLQATYSRRIKLRAKEDALASLTQVRGLDWKVLVYQPDHTIRTLLEESFSHSMWSVLLLLLIVGIFVVGVAYWVLRPIVRPVQRLQEAAVKLEQKEEYMPSEADLIIPNNEIGELARIFLQMAVVLRERKNALLAAQKELSAMNKDLEQRVAQRTAELHQATSELVKAEQLAAIGQMASIISHEIRNPLAVISNATRLIKVIQPPTDPKLVKQFAIIEAEIRQANGIIGEVLGFARSRDMILSTIDLNSYLHDMLQSFPLPHNVRIVEKLDANSVHLKIDSEEIKQALRNILSNACEAMPEGGHITVGTQVGKEAVCIFIADEGPGISEALKEKIFSPFFTTKARGTGLGLAVVRKAVARHKGKLYVHNLPQKGAIFEIYLRIYRRKGDTHYG